MNDLIQKQKIDTQNIIFKILFKKLSHYGLSFAAKRGEYIFNTQVMMTIFAAKRREISPRNAEKFRRETPRNFAAKFLLFLAVSPRNCQFRVCSFRVSPRKMRFLNCADCSHDTVADNPLRNLLCINTCFNKHKYSINLVISFNFFNLYICYSLPHSNA